jgi:hypothetical protein
LNSGPPSKRCIGSREGSARSESANFRGKYRSATNE